MGKEIKIFLTGIANSLKTDGYYHIVTPPKELGKTTTEVNLKRAKSHRRIKRKTDERIAAITA